MSAKEVKARLRCVVEQAYHQGRLEALDELYAPGIVYHRPPLADIEGLEALKAYVADLCLAFSGVRLTLHEIVVEGDILASRWTLRGSHTQRSPSMPVPPTGKEASVTGCSMAHWAEGRINEEWNYTDWLGLFQQLGVIPPMG